MSKITKGYVFKLRPTHSQQISINKTLGCNRKMWNELLDDVKENNYRTPKEIKQTYDFMYECDSQSFTTTWKHPDRWRCPRKLGCRTLSQRSIHCLPGLSPHNRGSVAYAEPGYR